MRLDMRLAVAAMALSALAGIGVLAADSAKPKYTVEEVMEKAHDRSTGLLGKVIDGKATEKDKKDLVEMYVSLAQFKPSRGEAASWKKKTEALVAAAKDTVAGKEGATKKLKAASSCSGCHKDHK